MCATEGHRRAEHALLSRAPPSRPTGTRIPDYGQTTLFKEGADMGVCFVHMKRELVRESFVISESKHPDAI